MPVAAQVVVNGASNGAAVDNEFLQGITNKGLRAVLAQVQERDPHQPEFLAAVKEVATALAVLSARCCPQPVFDRRPEPVFEKRPEMLPVFGMMCEPERAIVFRVPWLDDAGNLRVNRGYRVQFSSAIGPYKGGLRFRKDLTLSVIKFLGFEQMFKNALTTLPMGAGKGGSDFDPKDKSDAEIQRFCQSFMTELYRHIGAHTDVPAGDIGVGGREIGYLFGQYKRITALHTGALTGKGLDYGGSQIRPEATGFGTVIFALAVLKDEGKSLKGKRCIVTGSGNVAQYCVMKLLEEGATVLAMSDSLGYVYKPDGFTMADLEQVMAIKSRHSGKLRDFKAPGAQYVEGRKPWELNVPVDMAYPCATQHELNLEDATNLFKNGCKYVFEGANMPSTDRAIAFFHKNGVVFGNGKAANAGGVAVSGLEMSQNRIGLQWSREEVEAKLTDIMNTIYRTAKVIGFREDRLNFDCLQRCTMNTIYRTAKAASIEYNTTLDAGANIAAFLRVGEAVLAQGAV
ncbi:hypothetical protein COHA_008397 [Chlorella ohadii]|uniref:Glutamate dehydrogenase n=1 Tax=Chlorella ohadii TaxID=2649997 RepID=A0AAD5DKB7_9CHLO|nr:hypothetical protein COHA_008397 [Chlorella ohadii]